jgi:hypothetical protein
VTKIHFADVAPKQLQASYTDGRHREEMIDFIDKHGGLNKPYIMALILKLTWEQNKVEEEYMGLYIIGHMILDPIYGQITYNCWLSKAFKLTLEHNLKI